MAIDHSLNHDRGQHLNCHLTNKTSTLCQYEHLAPRGKATNRYEIYTKCIDLDYCILPYGEISARAGRNQVTGRIYYWRVLEGWIDQLEGLHQHITERWGRYVVHITMADHIAIFRTLAHELQYLVQNSRPIPSN
ncbi:hypothetical protein TNCV_4205091 [Trichonephila clavipes]|nr:hypothetical protein TNCV_4205091 [Trichonephila clavipes]